MMQFVDRRRVERRTFERRRNRPMAEYSHAGIYLCHFCNHDALTREDDINYHIRDFTHSLTRVALQLVDLTFEALQEFFRAGAHANRWQLKSGKKKQLPEKKQNQKPRQVHWSEYLYEHFHLIGQIIGVALTVLGGIAFAAVAFCLAVFPSAPPENMHEKLEREYRKKRQEDDDRRREDDEAYEAQRALED